MTAPKRIQRRRTRGWRMPEGAVDVTRPGRWGNPYLLTDVSRRFPSLTVEQCAGFVVNEFRDLVRAGSLTDSLPSLDGGSREVRTVVYPSIAEIRSELRGHDLACWCPLCDAHADGLPLGVECLDCAPCHADVLLELANR